MKLALLSDIHANVHALHACLVDARAAGATHFAVLGDLVGYGAHPAEVVDVVMALAREGAPVLRGNHDEAALHPSAKADSAEQSSAAWTHQQLRPAQLEFLDQLPLTAVWQDALLVHASAHEPQHWTYVTQAPVAASCLAAAQQQHGVTRVFCGHVHEQRLFYEGRGGRSLLPFSPTPGIAIPVRPERAWVATVGSVGQPRDGDPRAMYALFDAQLARLTFQRVAYDHAAAAADIRRAGLPPWFADRLELAR